MLPPTNTNESARDSTGLNLTNGDADEGLRLIPIDGRTMESGTLSAPMVYMTMEDTNGGKARHHNILPTATEEIEFRVKIFKGINESDFSFDQPGNQEVCDII